MTKVRNNLKILIFISKSIVFSAKRAAQAMSSKNNAIITKVELQSPW